MRLTAYVVDKDVFTFKPKDGEEVTIHQFFVENSNKRQAAQEVRCDQATWEALVIGSSVTFPCRIATSITPKGVARAVIHVSGELTAAV